METIPFLELLHRGQRRQTGNKFTSHLYAVRDLLSAAGIEDEEILDAALYHDVLEDSALTREFLEFQCGTSIATIVETLTKSGLWLTRYCKAKHAAAQLESGLEQCPKAAVIKIADRLHNVSTIRGFSRPKQLLYLSETEQFLLPLFRRWLNDERLAAYRGPMQVLVQYLEEEVACKRTTTAHA
ncbi:HD domain-containing protein [Gimesia algae]|uniref:Bifunctional (P)ppGpp synthase/hydrolase relA n=1 Tax=Gimesia algae TaxID=2527971 RepID=A0A517VER0_9PLAN|nr:HD domain-containing protein [Gimesia algae]QDT91467.1 Bifunctional (p)ppGpp synthase/hydrolase relA [Gimesia algae]